MKKLLEETELVILKQNLYKEDMKESGKIFFFLSGYRTVDRQFV